MNASRFFIFLFSAGFFVIACTTEPEAPPFEPEILSLPADPSDYAPLPTYVAMDIPEDNPITAEKAALGRQLFFDQRISGDASRSCYSCHVCELGLADGKPTAVGAFDKVLTRNSPTLWNIGYHPEFYWDGRAKSLEAQALAAWKGGNMGANPDEIVAKLNSIEGYRDQFQKVFNEGATPENVSKALAAYMRTIVSHDTPWDGWQAGDESAVSDAAKRGYEVFKKAECNNCHDGVLFTDFQYHNVGIGMDAEEPDLGRYKVTQDEKDKGAFKTPTLRDVAQSAPYFHDGSTATLEEVVDIMVGGGKENPQLDRANLKKVTLSPAEKEDLLEFLRSLDQPCALTEPPLPSVRGSE
ncbi:c-type cytochrome [Acidobacteria bacterium AH-259-O06]|nr:c-type cytochrome [Acidobacteria bacterium AH-259-O06]